MAVYLYNNRSIAYQMELAPFAADLILVQGSRFTPDYWKPVLEDLGLLPPSGGRIMTCDWASASPADKKLTAEDFLRLVQTLGLQTIHVVACDDAVDMIGDVLRLQPNLFEKTLLFPENAPKGEELMRAVRAFCPI